MTAGILACDLGTSSCKLAAFDAMGAMRATASASYPTNAVGTRVEQDSADWMRAFRIAVAELAERGYLRDPACIAFTGQMSAALPVDSAANPLRPCLIWSDQRASTEASAIEAAIGHEAFYRITGNPISSTYTIAKALWIARHEPDVYRAAAYFLQPKDWLIAQLTGIMAVDISDASCTGLMNLRHGTWDSALATAVGLDARKLPPIAPSTAVIGRVTTAGAAVSGLPHGLPVVLGGGDGPTSALGAGIVRSGQSYVSLGTSAWVSFLSAEAVVDPHRRIFSLRHVVDDLFAHTGATQNAANALSWLTGNILGGATLESGLAETEAGADGLLCLPYLNGERTPYWSSDAAGVFFGLRPQHRSAHMVRALAEGVCHHLRLITDVFADLGMSSADIVALGGLAQVPAFVGLLASAIGKPHLVGPSAGQVACRGAAILGAIGIGLFPSADKTTGWIAATQPVWPDRDVGARMALDHSRFLDLYQRLAPLFEGH